jgi:hypothetical protein
MDSRITLYSQQYIMLQRLTLSSSHQSGERIKAGTKVFYGVDTVMNYGITVRTKLMVTLMSALTHNSHEIIRELYSVLKSYGVLTVKDHKFSDDEVNTSITKTSLAFKFENEINGKIFVFMYASGG